MTSSAGVQQLGHYGTSKHYELGSGNGSHADWISFSQVVKLLCFWGEEVLQFSDRPVAIRWILIIFVWPSKVKRHNWRLYPIQWEQFMNGPLGFSECISKKKISNHIKYQTDQYTIWIKPGKARTCQPTSGSSPFYCKHDFFAKRRDAAMCAIWRSLGSK